MGNLHRYSCEKCHQIFFHPPVPEDRGWMSIKCPACGEMTRPRKVEVENLDLKKNDK